MRERLRNFERVYEFFLFTQKRIERFNESRFKSRKVKGRATSSENRKFFVAVMEGTLEKKKKRKRKKKKKKKKISILARGRSSFHLSALEATFIKSLNPFLCKQKEFVYSLKIS